MKVLVDTDKHPIAIGATVPYYDGRNGKATLTGIREPDETALEGRIEVEFASSAERSGWFWPGVICARFVDESEVVPLPSPGHKVPASGRTVAAKVGLPPSVTTVWLTPEQYEAMNTGAPIPAAELFTPTEEEMTARHLADAMATVADHGHGCVALKTGMAMVLDIAADALRERADAMEARTPSVDDVLEYIRQEVGDGLRDREFLTYVEGVVDFLSIPR